ncbi:hypothetical protein FZEAL_2540 [Fusarium zealandicum]|uniref:Uncharacterized protein n=1 Tax=Fusarium zealandicum TaxID=1053134 RepID=A0A8H4XMP3_9HYPO|nr:hypothetical protein FZEAL_2540 [Fusarium zealandicum]
MHFSTAIVGLVLAASARADFYIASSSGMRPGCAGAYCAGTPTSSNTYVYHSGEEGDICGNGVALGADAYHGTKLCDTIMSLDAETCGGRKVVFSACTEIKGNTVLAKSHFADVLDEDGNKIGECNGMEDTPDAVTCANWGSEMVKTTVYCRTEGHDHHMC